MEREHARARILNHRLRELGEMAQTTREGAMGNDEFQAYFSTNFGDGKGNYPTQRYVQNGFTFTHHEVFGIPIAEGVWEEVINESLR